MARWQSILHLQSSTRVEHKNVLNTLGRDLYMFNTFIYTSIYFYIKVCTLCQSILKQSFISAQIHKDNNSIQEMLNTNKQ